MSVSLRRGDRAPVSNLLSSLGGVKETHLSAMLGYLIHLNPQLADLLFGIHGPIEAVSLEPRSEDGEDRYDIVIHDAKGESVIEVKIAGHSLEQIKRYQRSHARLFTIGDRLRGHVVKGIPDKCFCDWERVSEKLELSKHSGKRADIFYNRLVDDFIIHLKENNMIQGAFNDVYVRDLSGDSVEIYFNKFLYKCQPKFFDGAKNARYFAPYLTKSNSTGDRQSVFRALGVGISFTSKVRAAFLASEKDILGLLKEHDYTKGDISQIYDAFKWRRGSSREHTILLLDAPMRLFQRPVTKYDLWKNPGGAMSSMSMDFGDLLAAANGLFPLQRTNIRKAA